MAFRLQTQMSLIRRHRLKAKRHAARGGARLVSHRRASFPIR
jgi:hypothetical protein